MADFEPFTFDPTAFMSGQVGSKVWLCEKLEPIVIDRFRRHVTVWLLGGWYGMTNFLLQSRRVMPLAYCVSYDIDPEANRGARVLNESYQFQGTFRTETADANTLSYEVDLPPDVVINTSTEHMESDDWFHRIPAGTICLFQSNNMPHDDHVRSHETPRELAEQFPLSETLYLGAKSFHYPTWAFQRFMHIGVK